jgi:hypothetical protein
MDQQAAVHGPIGYSREQNAASEAADANGDRDTSG